MQALLILVALVVLAVAAVRYGVDSRDGADWSPPARSQDDGSSAEMRARSAGGAGGLCAGASHR
jgi:hypothetical protein